ncbi:hypothetical protein ACIA5C_35820 [Actinoplanes sp. NPDC051343]|uniref:hypothetical protein n=1 Tax=Actinoplanes sp. NPDC051343 TaxID=3363906 RepID=UPI00379A4903
MTTRYERLKMQRRMQRRIQLVVEERRMSAARPDTHAEPADTGEATIEIPVAALLRPAPAPPAERAIGRFTVRSA